MTRPNNHISFAPSGTRVGVLVPNGPEAAATLLCTITWATCVPLNPMLSPEELRADLAHLGCHFVMTLDPSCPSALSSPVLSLLDSLTHTQALTRVLYLSPSPTYAGLFSLSPGPLPLPLQPPTPNSWTDLVMVLATAGTSGARKIVRYPLLNLLVGSVCIMSSWKLGPQDINLNMMPLFHIGGIARNLFAPILAGQPS